MKPKDLSGKLSDLLMFLPELSLWYLVEAKYKDKNTKYKNFETKTKSGLQSFLRGRCPFEISKVILYTNFFSTEIDMIYTF